MNIVVAFLDVVVDVVAAVMFDLFGLSAILILNNYFLMRCKCSSSLC